MKRSDFIQMSAFAAAAISIPFLNSCSTTANENIIMKPLFLSRLFDANTINETGKAYLKKIPGENSQHKLVDLLADNTSIKNSTNETAVHNYLNKKIQQDFEAGNTVLVKGWVLAVTEARQCALFALMQE